MCRTSPAGSGLGVFEAPQMESCGGADNSHFLSSSSTFHTCPREPQQTRSIISLFNKMYRVRCRVVYKVPARILGHGSESSRILLRHFPKPQGWPPGHSLFESGRGELPEPNTFSCTNWSLRTPLRTHTWHGNMHLNSGLVLLGTVLDFKNRSPNWLAPCPAPRSNVQMVNDSPPMVWEHATPSPDRLLFDRLDA